jgi:hypothetical protein
MALLSLTCTATQANANPLSQQTKGQTSVPEVSMSGGVSSSSNNNEKEREKREIDHGQPNTSLHPMLQKREKQWAGSNRRSEFRPCRP